MECKESQWHGLVGDARERRSSAKEKQGREAQSTAKEWPSLESNRNGAVWLSYAKDMLRFAVMRVGMVAFSGA